MRNVGPNVRVRNVLLCWFSCVRSPVFCLFFVESQFPCYQLHIVPTLCMPLPPLKVVSKSFRSRILQICGQCCSVCEPALPVLLGCRKRSLKGNGSCESICEAHAWNMRKAKKKKTCSVQESQHCISLSRGCSFSASCCYYRLWWLSGHRRRYRLSRRP